MPKRNRPVAVMETKNVREREFFIRYATSILDIMDGCEAKQIDAVLQIIARIGNELIW